MTEVIDFDSWADMRVGETGTMWANLDSVRRDRVDAHGIAPHIMVTNADWCSMKLEAPHVGHKLDRVPLLTLLCWRVRRVEDGLEAIACWKAGGVPIPLAADW